MHSDSSQSDAAITSTRLAELVQQLLAATEPSLGPVAQSNPTEVLQTFHRDPAHVRWPTEELILLVVGNTGSGKSTLVSCMCPSKAMPLASVQSNETECEVHRVNAGTQLIDTPGLMDNRRGQQYSDITHKKHIVRFCSTRGISMINGIMWTVDPDARLQASLVETARFIDGILNRNSWNQVLIVVKGDLQGRSAIAAAQQIAGSDVRLNVIRVRLYNPEITVNTPEIRVLTPGSHAENWQKLYDPGLDLAPFRICEINAHCRRCLQGQMDPMCFGPCHADIIRIHDRSVVDNNHPGALSRTHANIVRAQAIALNDPIAAAIQALALGVGRQQEVELAVRILTPALQQLISRLQARDECSRCHESPDTEGCLFVWDCCDYKCPDTEINLKGCRITETCSRCHRLQSSDGCIVKCVGCEKTTDNPNSSTQGCVLEGGRGHDIVRD